MGKNRSTTMGVLLLSVLILGQMTISHAGYLVENDDVLIWRIRSEDQSDQFYLKVQILNAEDLTLNASIYDPIRDTLTEQDEWALTARAYIYNQTVLTQMEVEFTVEELFLQNTWFLNYGNLAKLYHPRYE